MKQTFIEARSAMVKYQLRARGIHDERLLEAMESLPRHEFVPEASRDDAYDDRPLLIGEAQTISQPYIVALMTQALRLQGDENVLEIGTGSGYQTALLCALAARVTSIERVARLARTAAERLNALGYTNYDIHVGDGSQGLADMAPYDAIIVTAAAPAVPGPLLAQMHPNGGRLVIPVGDDHDQFVELYTRHGDRRRFKRIAAVRFVPLLGRYGFEENNSR